MTKKQESLYDSYKGAYAKGPKTELYQVYKSFSTRKIEALDGCKRLQYQLNGYAGTIVRAASYYFSYAFKFDLKGETWLCYCTHENNYKFRIDNGD